MKRIISLTISAVLLLALASCAAETGKEDPSTPFELSGMASST